MHAGRQAVGVVGGDGGGHTLTGRQVVGWLVVAQLNGWGTCNPCKAHQRVGHIIGLLGKSQAHPTRLGIPWG